MPIFIFNFDELDLNELEKVPSGLSNMKSEIDKLDIGKLKDFISNGFGATESRRQIFRTNEYDFLVDYNSANKIDILNIQKYLIVCHITN